MGKNTKNANGSRHQAIGFLRGERLHLRSINREDLPRLHFILSDPELNLLYGTGGIVPSLEKLEQDYQNGEYAQSDRNVSLGIVTSDDMLIGLVSIESNDLIFDRSGKLSLIIGDRQYLHKGYGTEACTLFLNYVFGILGYHKVNLEVYEYNLPAIHLYKKLGFTHEGTLRENNWSRGRFWDDLLMGITAEEWWQLHEIPPFPTVEDANSQNGV